MAYQTIDRSSASRFPHFGLSALGQAGERSLNAFMTWLERYQSRAELLRLDDHMLKDIGLTSADVEHEASKPFWRA